MRFDLRKLPGRRSTLPEVGEVYSAKGGRGDTRFWLVVAVRGSTLHLLGLDEDGEVVSTSSYAVHAIQGRRMVGVCTAVADGLRFPVERSEDI